MRDTTGFGHAGMVDGEVPCPLSTDVVHPRAPPMGRVGRPTRKGQPGRAPDAVVAMDAPCRDAAEAECTIRRPFFLGRRSPAVGLMWCKTHQCETASCIRIEIVGMMPLRNHENTLRQNRKG